MWETMCQAIKSITPLNILLISRRDKLCIGEKRDLFQLWLDRNIASQWFKSIFVLLCEAKYFVKVIFVARLHTVIWIYYVNISSSNLPRTGVPNLGYICLSEGVHLRLSVEEQNIFA